MSDYVLAWLVAFAFTQAVEAPIYRRLLRCSWAFALFPSALTHPLLWFVIFPYMRASYTRKLWFAESFAVLVEALCCTVWLARHSAPAVDASLPRSAARTLRALGIALLANATSLALGLLSRHWVGIP